MITINLSKAKQIAKDKIRKKRAPLFTTQDIAFQRALENGDDTSAIVAEKKRLRDLTHGVDQCTDTASLTQLMNWYSN